MSEIKIGSTVFYPTLHGGFRGEVVDLDKVSGIAVVKGEDEVRRYCYLNRLHLCGDVHPHHDAMIAYANGVEIECSRDGVSWDSCSSPNFSKYSFYRIKSTPSSKEKEITTIRKEMEALSERLKKLESE